MIASIQHSAELPDPLSRMIDRLPETGQSSVTLIEHGGKRLVDLVGASLGLVLLCPFLIGIGLLIRLGSRGPALFRQTRLGKNGRPFPIYKFRTMVADAEAQLPDLEALNESQGGVLFKIRRDPRITPLGRILRRTNLDELPQLYNILMGQMSFVGPRPLQLRDSHLLVDADPDGFVRRLTVTPGLTGPWQISDRRETDHIHMMGLDLDYIERWSLWLDLWLIVQTFALVVIGRPIIRDQRATEKATP